MNIRLVVVSSILASLSLPAGASTVLTNFDGSGFFETDGFDWAPGNALAVNAVPLGPGGMFTTYLQAELTEITNSGGGTKSIPIADNGPYEVTYTIELEESIQLALDLDGDLVPDIVSFNHLGGTVRMFWDDFSGGTINADGFGGNTGLGYDDGTLILEADVVPTLLGANFTLTDGSESQALAGYVALDQYGVNNLPGTLSVTGNGSAAVDATVTYFNETYIKGLDAAALVAFIVNGTLDDPFNTVNPELSVGGVVAGYGANNINGIYSGGESESFIFLQDAYSSIGSAVPAPGGLLLVGAGLSLMGFVRRRMSR